MRRLEALLDPGSIKAIAQPSCAVVAATGLLSNIRVSAFACDPTQQAGALGPDASNTIVQAITTGMREKCPVLGVWHSGGASLQHGPVSLDAIGRVFAAIVQASGRIPQISLVLGPAAGGAAYGPALSDVVIMGPAGRIFVTGPDVVRTVTGESIDGSALGGPDTHAKISGVAHLAASSDEDAMDLARHLVTLLHNSNGESFGPGQVYSDSRLDNILPDSPRRAYDVHPIVRLLLDAEAPIIELQPGWAPNMVTVLGRLAGRAVGILANNPIHRGGCLDSSSSEKAARFVRMCNAFGLALVVLVDVPGYLPGRSQEWEGVVRRGAKLLHAFAEAVVPRVTVITRKAYGGAFIAMNSKSLGATQVLAWPTAEVGVMSPSAAVGILHRRHLATVGELEKPALIAQLSAEYEQLAGGLARAIELGIVDRLVVPSQTRPAIASALDKSPVRRGVGGNIPL